MASPSASSFVNFVKKYPITLCGFSLLFMPSVHRLFWYFTPLLLSTAIFIVAMLSWGPSSESSAERGKKKGKPNEWAFNGSFRIYEEDDEEEREEEKDVVAEVSQTRKKLEAQLQEPDQDFDEKSKRAGTASTGVIFPDQGEPDCVGTVSNGAISWGLHGDHIGSSAAAPELQRDRVGAASSAGEPGSYLHGEHDVKAVHNHGFSTAKHQLQYSARDHQLHNHSEPALIKHDYDAAAGDHQLDSEPDQLDYHDAASDQPSYGDDYAHSEANQGDEYHDAEANPDLQGSEDAAVHAESQIAVENDDVRAAIAELRQKLGLAQKAPFSKVDGHDQTHSQRIGKGCQPLQAAA